MKEMDELLCQLLWSHLQGMGMFRTPTATRADLAVQAGVLDKYTRWLEESLAVLTRHGYLTFDNLTCTILESALTDQTVLWAQWMRQKERWLQDPQVRAQIALAEATMKALPDILTGKIPATEVLFPDSSMHLVEGIYKQNPVADYFNTVLVDIVKAYVQERLRRDAAARIRILEIGAGTGGSSAFIFNGLQPYKQNIAEYCYTDLSRAFLLHAEKEYGAQNPYLTYKLFNIEEQPAEQGIEPGSYDLVIATNVLHATRNIRRTLRHTKTLLHKNGLLLLNELTGNTIFAHLTFGLLEGWWFYEDAEVRIPGTPLLTTETWQVLLESQGFGSLFLPASAGHELEQQVFVAESDGVVRQKVSVNADQQPADLQRKAPQDIPEVTQQAPVRKAAVQPSEGLREKGRAYIKYLVGETLHIPMQQIDSAAALEKYGIDSILVVQLTNALRKVFSGVSSTLFFEYRTIDELVDHFMQTQKEALSQLVGWSKEELSQERVGAEEAFIEVPIQSFRQPATKVQRFSHENATEQKGVVGAGSRVQDIAIVGLAGRYPQADSVQEFWLNLKEGRNCITEIPAKRWDWKAYFAAEKGKQGSIYSRWGGFLSAIDLFDPLFFQISPSEAEQMDPQERLFLEIAYASIEDAGYTAATLAQSRKIGVFVGVMNGYYPSGARYWSIANRLSYLLNFQGPSLAVDTACSSSLTAIHLALESLYSGTSECAIVGGVNLVVAPEHYVNLSGLTMLSVSDQCRSFGDHADGFVDSEGVGALVLKPLARAVADGDHIYGVLKGSALNAGGKTNGYTVPNPQAQAQLITDAFQRSGVHPRTVSYIEAHGTGTALGDPIEIAGLTRAFQQQTGDKQYCAIGSAKSNIGHCESAAGIAGVTKVLLQLKHQQLAPSLHAQTLNPEIDFTSTPFVLQQELTEWKRPVLQRDDELHEYPRIAGISSFGAGGANAHVIIEEYVAAEQARPCEPITPQYPALIVLSARNEERLAEQVGRLLSTIEELHFTDNDLPDIAYTLQVGREAMEERVAFIVSSLAELVGKLQAFVAGQANVVGMHRGQVKRNKELPALFVADEELQKTLEAWITLRKYAKLLELWVGGVLLDWQKLYGEHKPRRISLPTYPFAQERYWIEKQQAESSGITGVSAFLHPLLHQNASDLWEPRFSTLLTGHEFFLSDHVIQGRHLLPGVAYLEMARAAIEQAGGSRRASQSRLVLNDVVWMQPLVVDDEPVQVYTALALQNTGEITFEIYRAGEDDEPVIYSQGRARVLPDGEIQELDLAAIQAQCNHSQLLASYCYEAFRSLGLDYGPAQQAIEQVAVGQQQVLAHLTLPASITNTLEQYVLHPSLMDAALQASMVLRMNNEDQSELALPFALEELIVSRPCTAAMWAWVRYSEGRQDHSAVQKFTIDLCDEQGKLCVQVKGFTVHVLNPEQPVKREALPVSSKVADSSALLTQAVLREKATYHFKKIFSTIIKLPVQRIEAEAPLEIYGLDSIMALKLITQMEKNFGPLAKTLFFEYQTIQDLTTYFLDTYHEQLITLLGAEEFALRSMEVEVPRSVGQQAFQPADRRRHKPVSFAAPHQEARQTQTAVDIAIVGVSGRYPQAHNLQEYWQNLREGKDCVTEIPSERWDHSQYFDPEKNKPGKTYSKWGGFLDEVACFDPLFFNISPREAEMIDPQERLFLQCVFETLEDAGYTRAGLTGTVGVYVGVMYEEYPLYGAQETLLGRPVALAGSPSSIANRVSHFCNFHGPSVALDTMCSSSLTAIHLACQSILRGECQAAIAGGVNVSVHPNKYLILAQGGFASSKGRCESFGQGGDGYVPAEGVGAVLLKPLAQAKADGDHIYGVIKGSAINHGGKTNGYSVPNPTAQAQVIRQALREAGVDARTISYIEAHGTGTALGDPIEITGLSKGFEADTQDHGYCAIGSAKSNIGHAESAAGIAGVTKVLLQLKHGQLAPSLHAEQLNPYIDFASTPFVVQRELGEWKRPVLEREGIPREYPRRAGISSFGAGGSNAHVIIEEYVAEPFSNMLMPAGPAMIVLSAIQEERLKEQAQRLLIAIAEQHFTDGDLAYIAYTLQVGREAMEERMAFLAGSIAELVEMLQAFVGGQDHSENLHRGQVKSNKEALSVFTADAELQEAIGKWVLHGKYAKLLDLWVKGLLFDWQELYGQMKPRRISLPPYPFAREKYWIAPHISRSAATTASLHPLVQRNTSTFALQRFSASYTGQEFFLADHVIGGAKMLPGVVYLEMARVATEFALDEPGEDQRCMHIRNIVWARPVTVQQQPVTLQIALELQEDGASTFVVYSAADEHESQRIIHGQGRVIVDLEREDIILDLAALQMQCDRRKLSPAQCYDEFRSIDMQYGPGQQGLAQVSVGSGQVLAELVLPAVVAETLHQYVLHPSLLDSAFQAIIGLLIDEQDVQPLLPFSLDELEVLHPCTAHMWAWVRYSSAVQRKGGIRKLDIDVCDEQGHVCVRMQGLATRVLDGGMHMSATSKTQNTLLLSPTWQESDVPPKVATPVYREHVVLLCEPPAGIAEQLQEFLTGVRCLSLSAVNMDIAQQYNYFAGQLLEVLQRIISTRPAGQVLIQVVIFQHGEHSLFTGLAGLLKTAQLEHPALTGQLIECSARLSAEVLTQKLQAEQVEPGEPHIRYQDGKRSVPGFQEVAVTQNESVPWKDDGIYLLTGGAGELGLIFAREIAQRVQRVVLILTGRSELSREKRARIAKLEAAGARIDYRRVDVGDPAALAVLLESIQQEYGSLQGIIHSAGVIRDRLLYKKSQEELREVFSPKVTGTVNLDEATRHLPLDFFILFSSLAANLGNIGQADYAAANAFLDAYAVYRNHLVAKKLRVGRTLSLNWPLWQDGGMQLDADTAERLQRNLGLRAMSTRSGIQAFYQAWTSGANQVVVLAGDRAVLKRKWLDVDAEAQGSAIISSGKGSSHATRDSIQTTLLRIVADVLKVERENVDLQTDLSEYGVDQLTLAELSNRVYQEYGQELTPATWLEYRTPGEVAAYLFQAQQDVLLNSQPQSTTRPQAVLQEEKDIIHSRNEQELFREKATQYFKKLLAVTIKLSSHRIDAEAPLEKYGLDSMLAMNITAQLEHHFGSLEKTLLFEYQSIQELTGYFLAEHYDQLRTLLASEMPVQQGTRKSPGASAPHPPVKRMGKPSRVSTAQRQSRSEEVARDIAVVGLAGRYPGARDLQEFWQNLCAGKDCITEVPPERWDHSLYFDENREMQGKAYSKWGGFLNDVEYFDPLFFNISPRDAEIMDPQERLFLETVWNLLESTGYTREKLRQRYQGRVGVYVGAMYLPYHAFATDSAKEALISLSSYNSIANRVSYFFNLQGPSLAVDTACSSSAIAIHMACQSLIRGESRLAIVGGVNLSLHPKKYLGLSQAQMIGSHSNSRSFAAGDGYLPAEGVGAVLLKPLAVAIEDNDIILAVIKATATNHSGHSNGFSVPNPNAQTQLIAENFASAKVDPRTISYVESAANGSALGDPLEVNSLTKAFQQFTSDTQFCAIGSVKSNIGHAEAVSGLSQLTKVILQMQHQKLVPSIKAEPLNPNIHFEGTPFYLQRELQEWRRPLQHVDGQERELPRRATISSFGAGGSNAHLIVEEYIPLQSEPHTPVSLNSPQILVFSAQSAERLQAVVAQMLHFVELHPELNLADLAYTLQSGREALEYRMAMIIRTHEELVQGLQGYLTVSPEGRETAATLPIFTGNLEEDNNWLRTLITGKVAEAVLQVLLAENNLEKIALHWTQGGAIPWMELYRDAEMHILSSLPTYPFARERYWLPIHKEQPVWVDLLPASGEKVPAEAIFTDRSLQERVQDTIAQFLVQELQLTSEHMKIHKNMLEYGVDSIVAAKLTRYLQKQWNIKVTGRDVFENPSAAALASHLAARLQAAPKKELVAATNGTKESHSNGGYREAAGINTLEKFKKGLLTLEEMEQIIDEGNIF